MVLRPSAHNQLTAHRAAAKESRALMRTTIADIEEINQHSMKVIDDGASVSSCPTLMPFIWLARTIHDVGVAALASAERLHDVAKALA